MARWVSQSEVPSTSKTALGRVRYLDPLCPRVDALIKAYFVERPDGETVVPVVLTKLGRDAVEQHRGDKTFDTLKQDLGRLIVIRLAFIYGPGSVFTYRENGANAPSTRTSPAGTAEWVRSYTPHRVVRTKGDAERIILDTNIVRDMLHGDAKAMDIPVLAAARGRHPISIADPAWAELVAFLLRNPVSFSAWSTLTAKLNDLLDPNLPIVPTGREAALFAGILDTRGYDLKLATSYYANVWRFTASATSPDDFARQHEYEGPDGHTYAFGPLERGQVETAFSRRIAAWRAFLDRTLSSEVETQEEALAFIRADMERHFPASAVDKLDLYVHSVVRYGFDVRGKTVPDENDAVDLDILFTTVLPAWVCTSDRRLRNIARNSGSADAWRVMNPDELMGRLATQKAGP